MLSTAMAIQVAVVGSGAEWEASAEEVGRLLAERGCTVVTGIGHARNLAVAASGDALIAVGGSYGTIAEMALGLRLGRPVVALPGAPTVEGALAATTPAEAVELALRDLGQTPL